MLTLRTLLCCSVVLGFPMTLWAQALDVVPPPIDAPVTTDALPFLEAEPTPLVIFPAEEEIPVMFEDLQLLSLRYGHPPGCLGPDRPASTNRSVRCWWQSRTVNWRWNSVHLAGCVPNGYWLMPFIVSAPTAELHSGLLSENGPIEPGGSSVEMNAVDGESAKTLRHIGLSARPPAGKLPADRAALAFAGTVERGHLPGTVRNMHAHSKYWQASLLNHQPLYFEDASLERHGYSYGLFQPVVSGAKFFGTLPALPYLMAAEPPYTTEYVLGEGQAGNVVPYAEDLPPASLPGGFVEAGVIVGLIFLIP